MEDFRSRSCGEGRRSEIGYTHQTSDGPNSFGMNGMQDLRCYSTSYASSNRTQMDNTAWDNRDVKMKKGKSSSSGWGLGDPELQRKKRVASYKAYTVEGKLKGSFKKSFRWIKERCSKLATGW